MNTIIVWVLMTVSGSNGIVTYSPAFATQAECQRVEKLIPHSIKSSIASNNQCVQMEIVK
jgi:hypothetical protein